MFHRRLVGVLSFVVRAIVEKDSTEERHRSRDFTLWFWFETSKVGSFSLSTVPHSLLNPDTALELTQ